jgi:hypothetical protein
VQDSSATKRYLREYRTDGDKQLPEGLLKHGSVGFLQTPKALSGRQTNPWLS